MPDIDLYNKWKALQTQAEDNMRDARFANIALIEIAAQHPLQSGRFPNHEFKSRLVCGIDLYKELCRQGKTVYIYVPGSVHKYEGVSDSVSLSTAGKEFLLKQGIPESRIFADDANEKYKSEDGVYNSTDECFVASKLFEQLQAGELHCVCSVVQAMRKALSYIQFGYLPKMHTAYCDRPYHNYVDEALKYIPILLTDATALQGDSEEAKRLREERKPK